MTRALMVRSIPLSRTTRDAWKDAGAMFARRDSNPARIERIANDHDVPIINLGGSNLRINGQWNDADTILPLLTPFGTRVRMSEFLPSGMYAGPGYYWLKGQGRGGSNKEKLFINTPNEFNELGVRATWMQGDVQQHVDGTEYRVITVGTKVVQVSKRTGPDSDRVYEWIGVRAADGPVKEVAREAARRLESDKIIIGWDVIANTELHAFILEGNSCPGVNEATANRILNAVEGIEYT